MHKHICIHSHKHTEEHPNSATDLTYLGSGKEALMLSHRTELWLCLPITVAQVKGSKESWVSAEKHSLYLLLLIMIPR